MEKSNLAKKLIGGLTGSSLVILVIGLIYTWNIIQLRQTSELIARTEGIQGQVGQLLTGLQAAETGQRSYLLTGNPAYLQPYIQSSATIRQYLAILSRLTAGHQEEQQFFQKLEPLVNQKLDELAETINLHDTVGIMAALEVVNTNQGQLLMESIKSLVVELIKLETQRRAEQSALVEAATERSAVLAGLLILLVFLVFAFIYHQVIKYIDRLENARKALRQSEEHYRFLADNSTDLISWTTLEGRILYTSPSCQPIVGYQPEELKQLNYFELIHPEDQQAAQEIIKTCLRGELGTTTVRVRRKGGDYIWVESNIRLIKDLNTGKVTGFEATTRDISRRKQAEEEIKQALTRAEELALLKSRFISVASHEFRNPISSILTSVELLEHYSAKLDPEKKARIFQRIYHSLHYLTGLVDDVLVIERAETGRVEFKPEWVNLTTFCEELAEEIRLNDHDAHRLIFRSNPAGLNGITDPKLLRQILSNLLSNAIKYSPAGTAIDFNLELDKTGTQAIFTVRDQGIGIPEGEQARLFETFFRASNVGTTRGTGLGLAIIKKNVELHQGKISFHSQEGQGTTFEVSLPLGTNANSFSACLAG